jgi:hypothetical protein
VTAASILCILYGVAGILWGMCGLVGLLFHDAAGGNRIPGYHFVHGSAILLEAISAGALLAAGFGLLSLQRWARILAMIFAALGMAAFAFQAAYQIAYVVPAAQDALAAAPVRPGAPFDPVTRWFHALRADFALAAVAFFVLAILYLAIILMMLLPASARRAFA